MTITRRAAIRNCFIITVGATLVPACMQEKNKTGMQLQHLKLDDKQQALITELSETIIPATDTPGSKDTYTHLFVLKMLDDMYTADEQKKYLDGLDDFDKLSKKKFDKSFVESTVPQREELLAGIINNSNFKDADDDISSFVKTTKKLTVQGYMTSKYYLTTVRIYKLVPGRYYGCVPVASLNLKAPSI